MSKAKNQWWAVKAPWGTIWDVAETRSSVIIAFLRDDPDDPDDPDDWKKFYRRGWRTVKVYVYEESKYDCPQCILFINAKDAIAAKKEQWQAEQHAEEAEQVSAYKEFAAKIKAKEDKGCDAIS